VLYFFNISENTIQHNDYLKISSYKKYPSDIMGFYDVFDNCREITYSCKDKAYYIGKGVFYEDSCKSIKMENRMNIKYHQIKVISFGISLSTFFNI